MSKKVCNPVRIENLKFSTNYDLSFNLDVSNVYSLNMGKDKFLGLRRLFYKSRVLSFKPEEVMLDNLYIDMSQNTCYEKFSNSSEQKNRFNLDYLPILNINNVFVKFDKSTFIQIERLITTKYPEGVVGSFVAKAVTSFSEKPIYIGKNGYIIYTDKLYVDDLSIEFPHSQLNISGGFNNLNAYGKSIPIEELGRALGYFMN